MNWLIDLITNPYLITGISSWLIAQIIKIIINAILHKEVRFGMLFADGGMPSGHSATVTSLATICALRHGFGTVEFAIAAILAIIVCNDAAGVRQETGKQAILLNEIIKAFDDLGKDALPEVKLKEFVGHTPIQVAAGVTLGLTNALLMHFLVF